MGIQMMYDWYGRNPWLSAGDDDWCRRVVLEMNLFILTVFLCGAMGLTR